MRKRKREKSSRFRFPFLLTLFFVCFSTENLSPTTQLQVARLLPSRLFGVIVLTTSAGIMHHEEARRKKVGGKVLGFFY